jgi:hypothetical protein
MSKWMVIVKLSENGDKLGKITLLKVSYSEIYANNRKKYNLHHSYVVIILYDIVFITVKTIELISLYQVFSNFNMVFIAIKSRIMVL